MKNSRLYTILLIDDDPDERSFFSETLEKSGLSTSLIWKENGEDLVPYLTGQEKLPDVLFLDINMPRKTGIECLREIRAHKELKKIPVVMYSTSNNLKEVEQCYQYGANGYVTKSGSSDAVQKILLELL